MSTLPFFKYHPDPVSTGMVEASQNECVCCGKKRGFIYIGPVYAVEEYQDKFCPWCIADGSASQTCDATFTDEIGIGGGGAWESVPDEVVPEVTCRTPGFSAWQEEQWWTHCGDAAAFLGRAGRAELEAAGEVAVQAIQDNCGLDGTKWNDFFNALDKEGSPTAYLFRCRHCGDIGGYQDTD
jgi:uncharacterized protein CbrC (UPF0167 family)